MDSKELHTLMRLQSDGAVAIIQPEDKSGPSLTVDLLKAKVYLSDQPRLESNYRTVFGVIGVAKLRTSSVLAVITGAKKVAELRGQPIYKITKTDVIVGTHERKLNNDDARFVDLLKEALNPDGAGRGLYFCYGTDLTLTTQRWASLGPDAEELSSAQRADQRFLWNRQLLQPLTDGGAHAYALPVMMGSIGQQTGLAFRTANRSYIGSISLIARRSTRRAGTRHWRRGSDSEGAVANFVETEQLVQLTDEATGRVIASSYVQLRGSIPLLWSQVPNIKYKPTTRVAPQAAYAAGFERHMRELLETYKAVVAINLANQHGSEGVLSSAFYREAEKFAATQPGLRLVPFDFHKECGAKNYHRLAVLWDNIRADFEAFGYYLHVADGDGPGPTKAELQAGVFRTNCIDCLDRTNVVQGVLGRKHAEALLARLGLLGAHSSMASSFPQVEQQFKILWADHGDDISRQYAGTGALKSGFTRTGKRTLGGLIDDGVKSCVRYYQNNFQDGRKQDAWDLLTGGYRVEPGARSPFRRQPSPSLPLLVALGSAGWALYNVPRVLQGTVEGRAAPPVVEAVLLPLVLACIIVLAVVKNGKVLVNRPQLCPHLTQSW